MKDIVAESVLFDLFYGGLSAVEANAKTEETTNPKETEIFPVDETTPSFRDIYIRDIVCKGADRAMYFNGLSEMPVTNINISNCTVTGRKGIEINYSKDVTLTGVKIHPEEGEPVMVANSTNVIIND